MSSPILDSFGRLATGRRRQAGTEAGAANAVCSGYGLRSTDSGPRNAAPRRGPRCSIFVLPFAAFAAHAFTIEHSATRYASSQYQCELTMTLDAPLERVETVLRDYESYPTLDPRILEARVLERPDEHKAVLETTLRACFGPFCRNVKRIEEVEESPGMLTALTDATRSDVKFGETHTALEAIDDQTTRVTYRTTITPGFWIPAIAGRRWMLRTLEAASSNLFANVEARAAAEP